MDCPVTVVHKTDRTISAKEQPTIVSQALGTCIVTHDQPATIVLQQVACIINVGQQGPSGVHLKELFEFEGDPLAQNPSVRPSIGMQLNVGGDPECFDLWWYHPNA